MAKMRAVEGIDVPAGKRVVLAPKGTHIMLMGLAQPLVAGETFPLELRFAKAGELGVSVVVRAAGAGCPAAAGTTLTRPPGGTPMQARAPLPLHRLHDEEIDRLLASGERTAGADRRCFGADGLPRAQHARARGGRNAAPRRARSSTCCPDSWARGSARAAGCSTTCSGSTRSRVAAGHLTRLALPRGSRLSALGVMLLNALKLRLIAADRRLRRALPRLRLAAQRRAARGRAASRASQRTACASPMLVGHSMGGVVARVALAGGHGAASRASCSSAHRTRARSRRCSRCAASTRRCASSPRSTCATTPRTSRASCSARCRRCTNCCRIPASPAAPNLFDAVRVAGRRAATRPASCSRSRGQRTAPLAASDPRCLHVVGVRQETVIGAERRGRQFHFRYADDGDGTVPRALAGDAGVERPGSSAEKHGGLPNNGRVISAVVDLLREGTTERLPAAHRAGTRKVRTVAESTLRRVAPHKVRWQDLSPDARRRLLEPVVSPEFHGAVSRDALRAPAPQVAARATGRRPIEIRLSRASIVDASARALVLGVFRNVDPSGAAAAVDERLGGAVRDFTLRRMFSGQLGEVFDPARPAQRPARGVRASSPDSATSTTSARSPSRSSRRTSCGRWRMRASRISRRCCSARDQASRSRPRSSSSSRDSSTACGSRTAIMSSAASRSARSTRAGSPHCVAPQDPCWHASPATTSPSCWTKPRHSRDEDGGRPGRTSKRKAGAATDPAYLLVTLAEQGRGTFECRSSLLTAGAKAAVLIRRGARRPVGTRREAWRCHSGRDVWSGVRPVRHGDRPVAASRDGTRRTRGDEPPAARRRARPRGLARAVGGAAHRRLASGTGARAQPSLREREPQRRALARGPACRRSPARTDGGQPDARPAGRGAGGRGAAAGPGRIRRAGRVPGRPRGLACAAAPGDRPRAHTTSCTSRDTASSRRAIRRAAVSSVLPATCCAERTCRASATCRRSCSSMPARRRGCAGADARTSRQRLFGLRRSSSLAEALLDGGVANFVGTHWPVGDEAALAFSTRFYDRLLDGERAGDAMLAARRRVFELGSIDWADYVHYGNPSFRLGLAGRRDRNAVHITAGSRDPPPDPAY